MVFDLSQGESYDNLDSWRQTFLQTTGDTNEEIPIVLIGNKADKGSNIQQASVMKDWVDPGKAKIYLETSALKYQGVEEAFRCVADYACNY